MTPSAPLINIDLSSFSISFELDEIISCETIFIRIINSSLEFKRIHTYKTNEGYINWIGMASPGVYVAITKNELTGDFIATSQSHFGCFYIKYLDGKPSCTINKNGSEWDKVNNVSSAAVINEYYIASPSDFTIDIVFAYHQSYLNGNCISADELDLWSRGEIAWFNTILINNGLSNITVLSKGIYEVEYENISNIFADDVFLSFFNRELVAKDLIKKHEENEADIIYLFSNMASGVSAQAGIIRQIHHNFNLIVQRGPVPTGTVSHEVGHLFGFHHDWGMNEIREQLKNNGHAYSPELGTIMSYSTNRVPYYSNLINNYPDTDVFMGTEKQNNNGFSQTIDPDGLTALEKCSLAFDRKDYPSIKINETGDGLFERFETVDLIPPTEEYNLLKGVNIYSPAGESVSVVNIGHAVDTTKPGFYQPLLKLEDESGRINYIHFYILVKKDENSIAVPAHTVETLAADENDPVFPPPISKVGIINLGPAKVVGFYYQTATSTGDFETIVEQDVAVNLDEVASIIDIPQTPISRWQMIIRNDTDVISDIVMQGK